MRTYIVDREGLVVASINGVAFDWARRQQAHYSMAHASYPWMTLPLRVETRNTEKAAIGERLK